MSEERKLIKQILYELNADPNDVDDIVDDIYSIIRTQDKAGVVEAVEKDKKEVGNPNGMMAFGMDEAIKAIESYYVGVSHEN